MKRYGIVTVLIAMIICAGFLGIFNVHASESSQTLTGTCGENLVWGYDVSCATLTISGTGPMDDSTSVKNGQYFPESAEGNYPWYNREKYLAQNGS